MSRDLGDIFSLKGIAQDYLVFAEILCTFHRVKVRAQSPFYPISKQQRVFPEEK
jgi:hypothetical protein